MTDAELMVLAGAGARVRLHELDVERQALLKEFPDLHVDNEVQHETAKAARTAAQRAAVSKRMKAYWAERRRAARQKAT